MNATFPILACSGPGAQATIAESIRIGYYNAAFVAIAIAVGILWQIINRRRGRWSFALFYVALGVLLLWWHPAWTIDAYKGDCGFTKRLCSYIFSVLAVCPFIFEFRATRNRTKVA